MTEQEFEEKFDKNFLDEEYSDYLMNNTDAFIGNGDMLIRAIESGNHYEGFKDYMMGEKA